MIPVHGLSTNAKVVKKVNFSVYGSDAIRQNAVTRVNEIALYTRGIPTHNGVNSLAMGSSDRRIRCTTCNELMQKCPGHNGEIRLPLPVYQALYIDHTLKVLRSVCFFCSEICLTDEDKVALMEKYTDDKTRFNHTYAIARTRKKCPHCKGIRPSYVRGPLGIKTEWVDKSFESEEEQEYAMQKFTPALAYSILDNIKDTDATNFFGKGLHPRDLIATSVLVPPPIIRPAISTAEGSRTKGQDDITLRLQEINRRGNELRLCMNKQEDSGLPTFLCDANKVLPQKTDTITYTVVDRLLNVDALTPDLIDRWNRLQADVFGLVNPAAIRGGMPASMANNNRNSANGKYIIDRIRGKNGRFRNCLMGKRVNFSGRSVITPDSTIDVDQLGVPYELAMILTVPEKVTPSNIADLRTRILNGPTELIGAQSVINTEGDLISLKSCKNRADIVLRIGWIVERHLKNGDWVIFNRQPTLHRMGFNGHRVVLTKGKTFRLNLSVCAVYNADFDGDEMNIHVCQSACATSEVSTLMAINRNIISAQNNKPCFGIVQDSLVGAWLMTDPSVFLTRADMLRFRIYVKFANNGTTMLPPPAISKPKELWTGSQLISFVFPYTLMYQRGSISGITSYDTKDLLIQNGQILFGRLSKSTLGATAGAISDIIHHEHGGPKKAVEFLSDVQRVVNQWLLYKNSFSIGASDCVTNEQSHNEVVECIKSAVNNSKMILTSKVPKSLKEMAEGATTRILSDVIMKTATIIKNNAPPDNSIITCVTAGSKGSPLNIAQVCGQVGQQIVGGARILNGTSGRTLPCFKHGEHATVNANGYIQNSFMLGLQPTEFFFSAMSGREGLVDTAVKTANSGYIQRCLVKASEDNMCNYDGTIRNAQGMVVQFKYADNFDPCKVERIKVEPLLMTPEEIKRNAGPLEYDVIMSLRENAQKVLSQSNKPLMDVVLLPINISRMFESATWNNDVPHEFDEESLLTAVSEVVHEIVKKHPVCKYVVPLYIQWCMRIGNIPEHLNVKAFLCEVKHRCLSSVVAGGDAVGNTAALSIGEPSTQAYIYI
ncbi:putative DNA-dependent RNA polymerase II largest subunit [Emiliania huxleyi virus 145]|nr:DNA-directed RNA polymerase subunit beta [Emiliania huxleyi virus 84]AHA54632.1 putative DNA-dependent RNA polymerase II largest subunit [Emiliania huxleyi virus 145]AHA55668.1 putative DNA-dependent RNA polymerase II largest subunit [Emiliania huxleyi virus 164]